MAGSRGEPHADLMPTPTSVQRGPFEKHQRGLSLLVPSSNLTQGITVTGQGWVRNVCPAIDRGRPFLSTGSPVEIGGNEDRTDGTRIPVNHLQTMRDGSCWDKIDNPPLTSEGLRQWEMHAHVDHVFDLVPFWQRGIDAAEKGEVLRLEEFLEKMEGDGGWRTANEVLGMLGGWKVTPSERARGYGESGWGQPYRDDWGQCGTWASNGVGWAENQRSGWGVTSTRVASDVTESSRGRNSGWGIREEWAEGRPDFRGNAGAAQDGWGAQARVRMVEAVRGDGMREEMRHFVDAIAQQEAATEERRRRMHMFFEMSLEQKIEKIKETIGVLRRTHMP